MYMKQATLRLKSRLFDITLKMTCGLLPFAYGVTIFLLVITRAVALFTLKTERGREEADHNKEHGVAHPVTQYSVYNETTDLNNIAI